MSMNVYITAVREVTAKNKAGKKIKSEQVLKFNAVQTPTKATYEIVGSEHPSQAYIDWCLALAKWSGDKKYPIYAADDHLCEKEPIGFESINFYKDHVEEFRKWVDSVEEEGYIVKIEVI